MSVFRNYKYKILAIIRDMQLEGVLPKDIKSSHFSVEPPRDEKHGDLATNIAMIFAKPAGMKPRDLAEIIAEHISKLPGVTKTEIAGAGFINMSLDESEWHKEIATVIRSELDYGRSQIGEGKVVNIEYVSANPTGPLHVGHVRGAVFGDALANLYAYAGYKTIKEYYINDAGTQIDTLAHSVYLRYLEALGEDIGEIPDGYYPGEYLIALGQDLAERYKADLKNYPQDERHPLLCEYSVNMMMRLIKEDLESLSIRHDVFTSEKKMIASGAVEAAISTLLHKELIYEGVLAPPKGKKIEDWEERTQTLFKASAYGDDTDRPLKKSDGNYTYFATDIAYHHDKFKRGADLIVNIWGADHGGYVKRIGAAIKAISDNKAELQVKLCQIVHLYKNGQPYKMSKRSGQFVTLKDIISEVGPDVIRFMMLTRKNDAQLDFDFTKATEQSKDNPVFYVQYAHARVCSVLAKASEELKTNCNHAEFSAGSDLSLLQDNSEKMLMRKIAQYPRIIEQATEAGEPHRIAFYLGELASMFHAYWNKGKEDINLRFIIPEKPEQTKARLTLIRALSLVIKSGLNILGVKAIDQM
ncbi:MAG: arginine--tRNA ligase [Pseudomonadota bacterium]